MVANSEGGVGEDRRGPDGVTGWVAVPLCILERWVAEVVEFFRGVVGVDVSWNGVYCAVDFV